MAKAKRSDSKKTVWTVPNLEKRVQALVQEGVLVKKGEKEGEEEIVKTINAEFEEPLAAAGLRLSRSALHAHLPQLVWTKKVHGDLWRAISNDMVDVFEETYAYITKRMVAREVRKLKGVTRRTSAAEFKAGMGRLSADTLTKREAAFEFPVITYENPLVVSKAAEGQLVHINSPLVGIKYSDIESNNLRRPLADARKRGAAAVLVTNLIELWTRRTAGYLAVYRAIVSGIRINPDRFPKDYQQEVRDILSGKITDKMIYQTLNERFEEIMDGLHKVTHRKNGKGPEFPGSVYVVLCSKEEEIINAAAYYESRYRTIVEQNKLEAAFNMASNRLKEAEEAGDVAGMKYWSKEVERLGRRKNRAIIMNHAGPQYEMIRRRMRAYVVKRLEETIPNCKVISQSDTWLRVSDKTIKIHIPEGERVTDRHLRDLGDTYGVDVFRDTLADLTISCPAYSLNHRDVGREDSKDGQPVTKYLAVAPSCLDGEFLREEFKDATKLAHPVQKLVANPQFQPGVLVISWANGLLHWERFPMEKLGRCKSVKDASNFAYPYPRTKYFTWKLTTDNHAGGTAKRFIWDPKERVHLGIDEAANEMIRRLGVLTPADIRIHFSAEMDDATDGNLWFNPTYRPSPRELSIIQIERWLQRVSRDIQKASEKGDHDSVSRLLEEVNRFSIAQLYFKGEHFPFHQMMQVYDRRLDPQADFYSAVLERFAKSGLVVRGISKINNAVSDTRDLGVINFPNGNHRINTLGGADLEGEYFARHLQAKLAQRPAWRGKDDFLREVIRAPRFGNATFGWGTVQAPGGYAWGIRVHGSPARQSGWSDILGAIIKSDIARGDDGYGLGKHVTVTFFGDKHFYAKAETKHNVYVMCAAGVHTDTYGSVGGFPPNNTGVCFVSIPADGPDAGPIIVRRWSHDFMRDWFAKPTKLDWEKFLPEPV